MVVITAQLTANWREVRVGAFLNAFVTSSFKMPNVKLIRLTTGSCEIYMLTYQLQQFP